MEEKSQSVSQSVSAATRQCRRCRPMHMAPRQGKACRPRRRSAPWRAPARGRCGERRGSGGGSAAATALHARRLLLHSRSGRGGCIVVRGGQSGLCAAAPAWRRVDGPRAELQRDRHGGVACAAGHAAHAGLRERLRRRSEVAWPARPALQAGATPSAGRRRMAGARHSR